MLRYSYVYCYTVIQNKNTNMIINLRERNHVIFPHKTRNFSADNYHVICLILLKVV